MSLEFDIGDKVRLVRTENTEKFFGFPESGYVVGSTLVVCELHNYGWKDAMYAVSFGEFGVLGSPPRVHQFHYHPDDLELVEKCKPFSAGDFVICVNSTDCNHLDLGWVYEVDTVQYGGTHITLKAKGYKGKDSTYSIKRFVHCKPQNSKNFLRELTEGEL